MSTDHVTVRLFAGARAAAGGRTDLVLPVAGTATLAAVLADLSATCPGVATVLPACSYLVDGVSTTPAGMVAPGATVDVLPPFSGG